MGPQDLTERLRAIDRKGLYRYRFVMEGRQGVSVVAGGRTLVNFCSNDYLGLAGHPEVVAAFARGAERYGGGAGASHLICGHGYAHHALEEELADFTGRERALLFSTGYMANLGVISALAGHGDAVFEDRLNHASLLDGARLSGARLRRYAHADSAALQRELAECTALTRLVVTDGVFSMDGDVAPLAALAKAAREHAAWLVVDDAHGLGVLGEMGRGSVAQSGLGQDEVPVLIGTLGKAFGTFGAFVAGSADLVEYLIQRARTYIYTTALPPAVAEATRTALRLVRGEDWRRQRLRELVGRFRAGAAERGYAVLSSETPIQPLLLGGNETAVQAASALAGAGFLVSAIRPPTVPEGTARLRITLTAEHTDTHLDGLLDALAAVLPPDQRADASGIAGAVP